MSTPEELQSLEPMTPEEKQAIFDELTILINEAFDQSGSTVTTEWSKGLDLTHKVSLKNRQNQTEMRDAVVTIRIDNDGRISLSSCTQYPFGHPNTGAAMPLASIPLDYSDEYIGTQEQNRYGFPVRSIVLYTDQNGEVQVRTYSDHGQNSFEINAKGQRWSNYGYGYGVVYEKGHPLETSMERCMFEGAVTTIKGFIDQVNYRDDLPNLQRAVFASVSRVLDGRADSKRKEYHRANFGSPLDHPGGY